LHDIINIIIIIIIKVNLRFSKKGAGTRTWIFIARFIWR